MSTRSIGKQYESLAEKHLETHGLYTVGKNFQQRCGELDLIMRDRSTYVFVEVKYRNNKNFGSASEMVTYAKSQKLIKTALLWLLKHNLSPDSTDFRFDIVAIHNKGSDIEWIKNAITQG